MKPKKDMLIKFFNKEDMGERLIKEIKAALETGVPNIQPKNVIQFDSVESFPEDVVDLFFNSFSIMY